MKKLLIVAAALVAVTPLSAQDLSGLYTDASAPPQEALDRLRLKTAWSAYVPMDGRRDGLFSVQLVPGASGLEVLIQTRSGSVLVLDGETGRKRWYTKVGVPYRAAANPAGYNSGTVFVINNIEMFALNRDTGRLQWQYTLPAGGAATPIADEQQIYMSLTNGRFVAYTLPNLAQGEKLAREGKAPGMSTPESAQRRRGTDLAAIGPLSGVGDVYRNPPVGPQPTERYSFVPEERVETTPVQSLDRILLPGTDGLIMGVTKGAARTAWRPVQARGRIMMPVGQYDDMAYVASTDYNLYAISIASGRVLWRFPSGGRPTGRPSAVEQDVYLPVGGAGLLRIDRAVGEEKWHNTDGARFLAANTKFVYAADANDRLVVIDRGRGTTLSLYGGTRDFVFPVANEWTDRIYLVANNGLIVCLRDRDLEKPLAMKKVPALVPPPSGGGKPAPKEPAKAPGDEMEKKP